MVNVILATTSCRICAARPSDLGKIDIYSLYLVRADGRRSLSKTQKSGVVPCGVVRSGWFFSVPASHGPNCAGCAEQCAERSPCACRCDYPLVVHGSARYGACPCLVFMDACRLLVCTMLGPARGDVPGYCGVIEKTERGTAALRWMLFVTSLVESYARVTYL